MTSMMRRLKRLVEEQGVVVEVQVHQVEVVEVWVEAED